MSSSLPGPHLDLNDKLFTSLTKAFKQQLIALVAQGRTPEQISREYEPTSQTIRNWVREAQKQQPALELEKDRQIRDLKAENARL